jgi:predicted phosphoribosyltransferase
MELNIASKFGENNKIMLQKFKDRREGGRKLAEKLIDFRNDQNAVVLALPRGGVPVGFEVADALNLTLDIFIVRKLGVPNREELAFGAIASGGITVLNESLVKTFKIPDSMIQKVFEREGSELKRREKLYRQSNSPADLRGKTIIIVDDGIATGATIKAAVTAIREQKPGRVIIAVPVASRDFCDYLELRPNDRFICLMNPQPFYGIGNWYLDFQQVTDEEVCDLLEKVKGYISSQNFRTAA